MAHPTEFVVGIDLGTTNSSVAVVQDGKVVVIPVNGRSSMPSAVGLDPSGKLMIGQAAKNQAVSAPENTVLSIKRLMGTDETVTLGGKSYRPEEISALILAELRRAAEQYLGVPVSKAVITVPAFFNEIQRHATQDAGKLAGLEVLRIINEPTAAALAYGAGQAGSANLETLLVYDLGGGTFDVSVVSVEDGVVEVRSSHGDIHLGGDDFDAALADYAVKQILTKDGITPLLQPAATRRLKSVMESAKIALSDAPFTQVREEYITPDTHLDAEISRSDYESLVEPFIQKTLDCLQQSLADAKVTAAQLSKVMLVGGATRTPLVQLILETKLGIEPRHEIDPDLVVTMGAAIQGAALAGVESPAVLVDITAHTYSLETLSGDGLFSMELICVPIIRRGSALPITKAEVFDTIRDNQEMVQLNVYQGESSEPTENLKIGEFVISGLSQVPSGNLILVQYSIDLNGLLTVTATEKSTGLVKSVTIDTAGQHRINLDAARTNLAELLETQDDDATRIRFDETDAEFSETITVDVDDDSPAVEPQSHAAFSKSAIQQLLASAKQLRHRADGLLALPISESDRHQLREILDAIGRSIQSRDWATLQSLLDSLSDLLFYLED